MTRCMVNRWEDSSSGYYGQTCYAPVFIFVGGICWRLTAGIECRPSRQALPELQRVIGLIRQQWKSVEIVVRGDSAGRDDLMGWCEV